MSDIGDVLVESRAAYDRADAAFKASKQEIFEAYKNAIDLATRLPLTSRDAAFRTAQMVADAAISAAEVARAEAYAENNAAFITAMHKALGYVSKEEFDAMILAATADGWDAREGRPIQSYSDFS